MRANDEKAVFLPVFHTKMLKDGIHNGKWSLGSKREKFGH